jgi:hypothetical protein
MHPDDKLYMRCQGRSQLAEISLVMPEGGTGIPEDIGAMIYPTTIMRSPNTEERPPDQPHHS